MIAPQRAVVINLFFVQHRDKKAFGTGKVSAYDRRFLAL
jgi:hypothetical protein